MQPLERGEAVVARAVLRMRAWPVLGRAIREPNRPGLLIKNQVGPLASRQGGVGAVGKLNQRAVGRYIPPA